MEELTIKVETLEKEVSKYKQLADFYKSESIKYEDLYRNADSERDKLSVENTKLRALIKVMVVEGTNHPEFKYKFRVPYFRITSYAIYVYSLKEVECWCWQGGDVHYTYRFTEVMVVPLWYDNSQFGQIRKNPGYGGRRAFSTCIDYDRLKHLLNRRVRVNHKNKGAEYATMIKDLDNAIMGNPDNWFRDYVDMRNEALVLSQGVANE